MKKTARSSMTNYVPFSCYCKVYKSLMFVHLRIGRFFPSSQTIVIAENRKKSIEAIFDSIFSILSMFVVLC